MAKEKVMVAMSGGVDSSVAVLLLKDKYELTGVTMKLFESGDIVLDKTKTCCSLVDIEDARSVAFKFDIPYYVYNFGEHFESQVINRFVNSYQEGRTPNPCIDCNRYIKFEALLNRSIILKHDFIATGHYARIYYNTNTKRYVLKKAIDETKDQTYALYGLTQEQLSRTLFPMGELTKKNARDLAQKSGLINFAKPDSQDICFVPNGNYGEFIQEFTGKTFKKGNFIDIDNNILGEHKGIVYYTVGQRKGLGLAFGKPYYVVAINADDNTITLGEEKDLYQKNLIATDVNFISIDKLNEPISVTAKARYKQKEQNATIYPLDNGDVSVVFDEPQRAITSGQAVVFYDGDDVVGGGTILSAK